MYPPYTLPFAKMYINNSENLTPGVNQFPHVSSAETETHNHFCHKSAHPFDLPGFSRQKSDRLHMARYVLIDVSFRELIRTNVDCNKISPFVCGNISTYSVAKKY